MNELKDKLAALGLSDEQIDGALKVIAEFVKAKLPTDYGSVVDSILSGGSPDFSALADGFLGKMKGLFD